MGDWNTLHLFDENQYKSETLPILKNENLISSIYGKYLEFCLNNTCEWKPNEIAQVKEVNNEFFKNLQTIESNIFEDKNWDLPNDLDDYHFRRFFTFIIFNTASNFYPYFKLGKNHMKQAINFKSKSNVSVEIIDNMFNSCGAFNWDGNGIRKIITPVDLSLLCLDLKNIIPNKKEDKELLLEFKYFIEYANKNNYGLISGQNLDPTLNEEAILELSFDINKNMKSLIYGKTIANKN